MKQTASCFPKVHMKGQSAIWASTCSLAIKTSISTMCPLGVFS